MAKNFRFSLVEEKLLEYEMVFGKYRVFMVLCPDFSGHMEYHTYNIDVPGETKRLNGFDNLDEFIRSNPLQVAKDFGYVTVGSQMM